MFWESRTGITYTEKRQKGGHKGYGMRRQPWEQHRKGGGKFGGKSGGNDCDSGNFASKAARNKGSMSHLNSALGTKMAKLS